MSRTYKDAPYWVRAKRTGVINHEFHERWLGSPITRTVILKDKDGNPVMRDGSPRQRVAGWTVSWADSPTFSEYIPYEEGDPTSGRFPTGKYDREVRYAFPRYQFYQLQYPVYVTEVIGFYSDECTDESVEEYSHPSKRRVDGAPICEYSHPYLVTKRSWREPPSKVWRKAIHSSRRSYERNSLTAIAKEYNGGTDLDSYDLVGLDNQESFYLDYYLYT